MNRWVRREPLRAFDEGDRTTVLGRGGAGLRFDGDSASLARAVLELLAIPTDRDALLDAVALRAGVARASLDAGPVDELLAVLARHGVIGRPAPAAPAPRRGRRVVLGVTGAVAAVDAPTLARVLLERGHAVRIALSAAARRFVSAAALEAITHDRVHRGLWDRAPGGRVPHIDLAEWAEVVLVYPCSATSLSRIASGDCGDLVSAVAVATRAPVVLAPSMNVAMYRSAAVQRNLDTLRDDGVILVHPAVGVEVAQAPADRAAMLGPAPAPGAVVDVVEAVLAARPAAAPADWDAFFRETDAAAMPWTVDDDRELAALRDAHAPAVTHPRLLDVGTGLGTLALAAARAGYAVTATDVAPAAIDAARASALPVTWVVDDAAATRVRGRFDVVTDRGCLHALPPDAHARYRVSLDLWLRPGGAWIAKVHDARSTDDHGTTRFSAGSLDALLGDGYERLAAVPCDFGGAMPARAALAVAYRRRGG